MFVYLKFCAFFLLRVVEGITRRPGPWPWIPRGCRISELAGCRKRRQKSGRKKWYDHDGRRHAGNIQNGRKQKQTSENIPKADKTIFVCSILFSNGIITIICCLNRIKNQIKYLKLSVDKSIQIMYIITIGDAFRIELERNAQKMLETRPERKKLRSCWRMI